MGLNLLGVFNFRLPQGPGIEILEKKLPKPLVPITAGLTFGLASSPCSTPVLAVLLSWIAQSQNPITGMLLLASFGIGQVIPLLIAGTVAAALPNFLAFKPIGKWIPLISGMIFLTTGVLSLLSRWI